MPSDTQLNFKDNKSNSPKLSGSDFANAFGTENAGARDDMSLGGPRQDTAQPVFLPKMVRPAPEPVTKPTPNKLHVAYQNWVHTKSPQQMDQLLTQAKNVMEKGITTYSGVDSPLMRGRAKTLTIQAIKSYDPESKANLSSWIMTNLQGLTRYRQQTSPIRIPERVQYELHHVNRAATELYDETGREPSVHELADRTGLSTKRIDYVRRFNKSTRTEGSFINEEGGSYLPGIADNSAENVWAEYVYHDLDDVNKQIYDMRVKNNMSVNDIAAKLKMSASAVSQRASKISDMLNEGQHIKDH